MRLCDRDSRNNDAGSAAIKMAHKFRTRSTWVRPRTWNVYLGLPLPYAHRSLSICMNIYVCMCVGHILQHGEKTLITTTADNWGWGNSSSAQRHCHSNLDSSTKFHPKCATFALTQSRGNEGRPSMQPSQSALLPFISVQFGSVQLHFQLQRLPAFEGQCGAHLGKIITELVNKYVGGGDKETDYGFHFYI